MAATREPASIDLARQMTHDQQLLARARTLADDLLFPNAVEADLSGDVPVSQLDALAEAGLYGAGVEASPATVTELIEIICGGCLTTGFVWVQHLGASAAAHETDRPAGRFADDLISGQLRGGVAFAHMLRPGPPATTATQVEGGWRFDGTAPWVTGWGHIDLVHAAARAGDDMVWALIDATESPTLTSELPSLAAVDSTRSVELTFLGHHVGDDRVTSVVDFEEWRERYRYGLRNNGSLPLGVASRCCRLLDRPDFDARLARVRARLDAADVDELPHARAQAALFAVTAATAVVASSGGRGVMANHHAQRLYREAMFLLVQGQTPKIRDHMLDEL